MYKFKKTVFGFIKAHLIEILIFTISLFIYSFTSSRSIVEGDTGDFLSAAAVGGVPHPSGYPLYSLLTRIAFLLPFGQPIWQANLLSAIFGAAALVFVYKTLKLITKNTPASLLGTFTLATYNSFWFYALVAQVHIFQVFILSGLIYYLFSASITKKIKYLYIASLFLGLGVSNNHTIIFILPAFLLILYSLRKNLSLTFLIKLVGVSLLGLTPYLYTLFSAGMHTQVNWDRVENITSFLTLFFRKDYGSAFGVPEPSIPVQYYAFFYYFKDLFLTSWFVIPFSFIGLISIWKKNKESLAILLSFVFFGPVFYLLTNSPIRFVVYEANVGQYFSYSYLFFSLLCGVGFAVLTKKFISKYSLGLSLIVIVIFLIPSFHTFFQVRQDNDNLTEVTTHFQLSQIPKNAVLLTWADELYLPTMYWQYAKKYRPDITVIELSLFNLPWYRKNLAEEYPFLSPLLNNSQFNYDRACQMYGGKNKLFLYPWYPEFDKYFQSECVIIPYGLITKVVQKNKIPNPQEIKNYNDKMWNKYISQLPPLKNYFDKYTRTRETLFDIAEHLSYMGIFYHNMRNDDWALSSLQLAKEVSPDEAVSRINESALLFEKGRKKEAIETLEKGIQIAPATAGLYKNLGLFYMNLGDKDKAYQNLQKYLDFNPQDKDVPLINNFILNYNITRNQ
ncbi:MAG TPA: DUF2723 domain-containing protein [Patescibacteria group bacterium]